MVVKYDENNVKIMESILKDGKKWYETEGKYEKRMKKEGKKVIRIKNYAAYEALFKSEK